MSNYYFKIDKPKMLVSHRNIPFYNQVFLLGSKKKAQPPTILYKYMRLGNEGVEDFTKRLIDTLMEGAVWFSTKKNLNDRCEMSYVNIAAETIYLPHPKAVFYMSALSKDVAKNFNLCRISCFSESWSSGPMWTNYSKGQDGVCVGFETKNLLDCFFPVVYKDDVSNNHLVGEDGLITAFSLKSEAWSYEKEWRLIYPWIPMRIKENTSGNEEGLIQSLNIPVKEIIFGDQVSSELKESILNNLSEGNGVDVYETVIKTNIGRKLVNP